MTKQLIIGLIKIEVPHDSDFYQANKNNPKQLLVDYILRFGTGCIDLQINETKEYK